jgi:hypothetical protein
MISLDHMGIGCPHSLSAAIASHALRLLQAPVAQLFDTQRNGQGADPAGYRRARSPHAVPGSRPAETRGSSLCRFASAQRVEASPPAEGPLLARPAGQMPLNMMHREPVLTSQVREDGGQLLQLLAVSNVGSARLKERADRLSAPLLRFISGRTCSSSGHDRYPSGLFVCICQMFVGVLSAESVCFVKFRLIIIINWSRHLDICTGF